MEGPTPVSALIHAATMVTAGRIHGCPFAVLFDRAPGALLVVAVIGAATAIFAASIASRPDRHQEGTGLFHSQPARIHVPGVRRRSICRGVFHLMTHAFFKALLFLGAGSVIHGMGGIQDIRKMGGLRQEMPWTFATFLSWDPRDRRHSRVRRILQQGHDPRGGVAQPQLRKDSVGGWLIAAGITSFYMFRLLILTFIGTPALHASRCPSRS